MLLVNVAVEIVTIAVNEIHRLVLINSQQFNLRSCLLIVRHIFLIRCIIEHTYS